ncbi:hypothetical protein BC936DRAFT_142128 [Jimgerdemannia flammicorona]|uniref:Uncharacterized protein n=1 Tax=Jimgerdemannia flammicorona TaxID=994334 RepID=A0A433A199_9FUNG|nr:hypothetical protein BC936DRAFT_142128 [Jimgerdemannia flammicorona]
MKEKLLAAEALRGVGDHLQGHRGNMTDEMNKIPIVRLSGTASTTPVRTFENGEALAKMGISP